MHLHFGTASQRDESSEGGESVFPEAGGSGTDIGGSGGCGVGSFTYFAAAWISDSTYSGNPTEWKIRRVPTSLTIASTSGAPALRSTRSRRGSPDGRDITA